MAKTVVQHKQKHHSRPAHEDNTNRLSDLLMDLAFEDRTFAGPFAYYSNVPMKVFAGNVPSVPLSQMRTLVAAEDALLSSGHNRAGECALNLEQNVRLCAADAFNGGSDPSRLASCVAKHIESNKGCLGL